MHNVIQNITQKELLISNRNATIPDTDGENKKLIYSFNLLIIKVKYAIDYQVQKTINQTNKCLTYNNFSCQAKHWGSTLKI